MEIAQVIRSWRTRLISISANVSITWNEFMAKMTFAFEIAIKEITTGSALVFSLK